MLPFLIMIAGVAVLADSAVGSPGSVQGLVLNEFHRPVAYALVSVPATGDFDMTDYQGRYSLTGLPAGSLEIKATVMFLEPDVKTAIVSGGGITRLDLCLRRIRPPQRIDPPEVSTSDTTAVFYGSLSDSSGCSLWWADVRVDGTPVCFSKGDGTYVTKPVHVGAHSVSVHSGRCFSNPPTAIFLKPHEEMRLDLTLPWDGERCRNVTAARQRSKTASSDSSLLTTAIARSPQSVRRVQLTTLVPPIPIFPDSARSNCICGFVVVSGDIDPDGHPVQCRVIHSDPPGIFDRCVLDALSRSQFALPPTASPDSSIITVTWSVRFDIQSRNKVPPCNCRGLAQYAVDNSLEVTVSADEIVHDN